MLLLILLSGLLLLLIVNCDFGNNCSGMFSIYVVHVYIEHIYAHHIDATYFLIYARKHFKSYPFFLQVMLLQMEEAIEALILRSSEIYNTYSGNITRIYISPINLKTIQEI